MLLTAKNKGFCRGGNEAGTSEERRLPLVNNECFSVCEERKLPLARKESLYPRRRTEASTDEERMPPVAKIERARRRRKKASGCEESMLLKVKKKGHCVWIIHDA